MRSNSRQRVKIPTPERLSNIALHYLSRFAASEQSLRRMLENRIKKAAMLDPSFAADNETHKKLRTAIETIIEKYRKSGALNDEAYAEMKVRGLRRAGKSKRAIEQKLAMKGIKKETAAKSLAGSEDENPEDAEMQAARIFAKRKKLGVFSASGSMDALSDMQRQAKKKKDMAAMARGGFSLDVIRKVLNGDADDAADLAESGYF